MYEIRVEGKAIDLFPDQVVEFSRRSGLFNPNIIEGNGTLPFQVKVTDRNKRIFGYSHLQQIGWRNRTFYAEKYAFGSIIERGYVKVQQADDQKIQCYFTQNLSEVFGEYQKTLLNKLPLGGEILPGTFVANANHLIDKYCLPQVQNTAFYGTNSQGGYNGIINEHDGVNYGGSTKVPMLFNKYFLERITQLCGISFLGDFMNNADYQRLIIHNTHSLDNATSIEYANHLPEMSVEQYFVELKKLFNLLMKFDIHAKTLKIDSIDGVLKKPCILDWSNKVSPIRNKAPEPSQGIELEFGLNGSDGLTKVPNPDFDKYRTALLAGQEISYQTIKSAWSSLTSTASGLPKMEMAGISSNFNQQANKFSPQFLFWTGLNAGKPSALNNFGNSKIAFYGANNLQQNCWQSYENWKAKTFACSADAYLTAADVVTFDSSEKVHINGVNYYVDELKLQLTNKPSTILRATLNLYKA